MSETQHSVDEPRRKEPIEALVAIDDLQAKTLASINFQLTRLIEESKLVIRLLEEDGFGDDFIFTVESSIERTEELIKSSSEARVDNIMDFGRLLRPQLTFPDQFD